MRSISSVLVATTVGILLFLLSGCGYTLRTDDPLSQFEKIAIAAEKHPRFTSALNRRLKREGLALGQNTTPEAVVHIDEVSYGMNASLVAPKGGLIEYERTVTLDYRIEIHGSTEAATPQTIERTQSLRVNSDKLLSTSAQERTVQKELVEAVVDDLIQAIAAATSTTKDEEL